MRQRLTLIYLLANSTGRGANIPWSDHMMHACACSTKQKDWTKEKQGAAKAGTAVKNGVVTGAVATKDGATQTSRHPCIP